MKKKQRPIWELSITELELLQTSKAGTVKVLDIWRDDHCPCVAVNISLHGKFALCIELWWLTDLAVINLGNPKKAWAVVQDFISSELETKEEEQA